MDVKQIFKKYHKRMVTEAVIKAVLIGIIFGFGVALIFGAAGWLLSRALGGNWLVVGLIVSIVAGLLVGVGVGFILYYKRFRPTVKQVAERVDALGLEERLITMTQYAGDDSFVAVKQQQDATAKLDKVDSKRVKFKIGKVMIALAVIIGALGLSITSVNILTVAGAVPPPDILIPVVPPEPGPEDLLTVIYMADVGGTIEGVYDMNGEDPGTQLVLAGESTMPVIAIADEGFMFDGWDDGYADPARSDSNIRENLVFIAQFREIEFSDDGDGEGAGEGNEDDEKNQEPQEEEDNNSSGGGGSSGNNNESSEPGSEAGGGKYQDASKIQDGTVAYQDLIDQYLEQIEELLANDKELTDEQRAMLETFYKFLQGTKE